MSVKALAAAAKREQAARDKKGKAAFVAGMLAMEHVPAPFKPEPIRKPSGLKDYYGCETGPTVEAHNCPACGEWESSDVVTGLCQRCHATLRLVVAMR